MNWFWGAGFRFGDLGPRREVWVGLRFRPRSLGCGGFEFRVRVGCRACWVLDSGPSFPS